MNRNWKVSPGGNVIYRDESQIQQTCVNWFAAKFPIIAEHLFSIPNGGKLGGKRNKRGRSVQGGILVGEGMKSGVADLFLALARSGLHGLFIETKTPVGTWRKRQIEFAERQIREGYGYLLYRSQNEFERGVEQYLAGKYKQMTIAEMRQEMTKKI